MIGMDEIMSFIDKDTHERISKEIMAEDNQIHMRDHRTVPLMLGDRQIGIVEVEVETLAGGSVKVGTAVITDQELLAEMFPPQQIPFSQVKSFSLETE